MRRMSPRVAVAAALAGALSLTACDEARVRDGASRFAQHEEAAMRVFVTPEGIGNIYDVANPDGFALTGDPETIVAEPDATVELGPIDQALAVAGRSVEPTLGSLRVTLEFRTPQIYVPVEVRRGFDVRICRFRVSGSLVTATGFVTLVETAQGAQLEVTDEPTVELDGTSVDSLQPCADALDGLITPEELASALVDYASASIASSAAAALRTTPLDVLGLIRSNLQISRVSAFDNRRGVLSVEGVAPQRAEALELTPGGLVAQIDAAADAQRARCAPPVALDVHQNRGTMPIDGALVERFGADFALAVSTAWLERLAQSATLAGFACHGLEAAATPDQSALIDTDDILLEEVGLDGLPLGPQVRLVVRPGSLPRVATNVASGTLQVTWEDLQIDVYGQLFGAWSRVVSVVSDAHVSLRPQSSVGAAAFGLEALEVADARVASAFLATPPEAEPTQRWAQRTMLLLLEERLELPLPLYAGNLLRVVNTQVRDHDIVYYLRFE